MRGRQIQIAVISIFLIASLFIQVHAIDESQESIYEGSFLDKILFNIISQKEQVPALEANEIDMIGDVIDPSFLDTLVEIEGLYIANVLRNGYGLMSFNCEKYPFSISQFRRAVAYAVDKEDMADDIWEGLATPLDSLVPQQNPLSIEGDVSFSYYEADNDTAIAILDSLGFDDINEDGYRELPNGTEFDVRVDYGFSSNIAAEVAQAFVDAYLSIGINATAYPYDFYYDLYAGLYDNFDMVFTGRGFGSTFSLEWMGRQFSNYFTGDVSRWSNESYNEWSEILLNASTYEEVAQAAEEMQKIWLEECPYIVAYQNINLNVYRIDTFTEFVNDALEGLPSFWTYYKVREDSLPVGHVGGTLRVSLPSDIENFNLMASYSASTYSKAIFDLLYDSLLRHDPSGNPIPWLATDYCITTAEDDESITEGHSRITFEILDNATWSDGEPYTAEDVRYSLMYYRDTENNPLGVDLQGLMAAYTPTPNKIVVEFNTSSYWNLLTVGYIPIMPKHVLQEIGISGWAQWNPDPLNGELVTSGPFNISDYIFEEYIELSRNPNYFYQPPALETGTTNGTELPTNWDSVYLATISASVLVIVVIVVITYRRSQLL